MPVELAAVPRAVNERPPVRAAQRIAVVGATGAVGREALRVLAERGVPADRVRALAGERSAGARVPYADGSIPVSGTDLDALRACDLVLLCADAAAARALAPACAEGGAVVIDNSSAFRLDPGVPLIVPEVNGHLLNDLRESREAPAGSAARARGAIIANPNCSTIILLVAIEGLRRRFGVRAINVATYQAVSGAGAAAVDELRACAERSLRDDAVRLDGVTGGSRAPASPVSDAPARVFAEPCAFNVFSHDSAVDLATGLNGEEAKIIAESRRIVGDAALRISPTCVRVPVVRAHTMAITVELCAPAHEREVLEALRAAEGVRVVDDRAGNRFPTPLKAGGTDDVLVGRMRPDPGATTDRFGRTRGFMLMACADQIRRGAATNAVDIAAMLGLVPGR